MKRQQTVRRRGIALMIVGVLAGALALQAQTPPLSIFHDPWLNWDFLNLTGGPTDDFTIIVENGSFAPNPADPTQILLGAPFQTCVVSHADYDGDADQDTMLHWSNPLGGVPLPPGALAHVGGDMRGSGRILDAYWTLQGAKVGPSLAISYERTEIRPAQSGEIHMVLQIAPGYYDDPSNPAYPAAEAGWTGIRTFRNIPADLLALGDLNRDLDLSALAAFEVTPRLGGPAGAFILPTDQFLFGEIPPDSFFDVYLDTVPDAFLGPEYESLLVATVLNQGAPIGMFWNLNPQSPEPVSGLMLLAGAALLLHRRRRTLRQ